MSARVRAGSTTLAADYTPGSGVLQVTSVDGLPAPPFSVAIINPETEEIMLEYRVFEIVGLFLAGSAEGKDVACSAGDLVLTPQIQSYSKRFVFEKRF